jgi:hypothetical protein
MPIDLNGIPFMPCEAEPAPSPSRTSAGRSIAARRMVVVSAFSLFVILGCRGNHDASKGRDHETEHAGHVIPAHKPKAFPGAIRRLRELDERIGRKIAEGNARALLDDKTLTMALDIANWLPEIAADSDMPEGPWNVVNSRSAAVAADYTKLLAGATTGDKAADALSLVRDSGRAISDLESLLAGADPRWFDGNTRGKAAP